MMDWFWHDGHLSWPLFAVLVYTSLIVLGADLVWRTTSGSTRKLALLVALVWLLGVVSIYGLAVF